jgi:hypothetical protein
MKKNMYRIKSTIFNLNQIYLVTGDIYEGYSSTGKHPTRYRILIKMNPEGMKEIYFDTSQEMEMELDALHLLLCPRKPSSMAMDATRWVAFAAMAIGLCAYGWFL